MPQGHAAEIVVAGLKVRVVRHGKVYWSLEYGDERVRNYDGESWHSPARLVLQDPVSNPIPTEEMSTKEGFEHHVGPAVAIEVHQGKDKTWLVALRGLTHEVVDVQRGEFTFYGYEGVLAVKSDDPLTQISGLHSVDHAMQEATTTVPRELAEPLVRRAAQSSQARVASVARGVLASWAGVD